MSDYINAEVKSGKLSGRFLQKRISSEIVNDHQNNIVRVDTSYLNALYAFIAQDPHGLYENEYYVGSKKKDIKNAGIRKVLNGKEKIIGTIFDFPVELCKLPEPRRSPIL